jgi:hypothetical protein
LGLIPETSLRKGVHEQIVVESTREVKAVGVLVISSPTMRNPSRASTLATLRFSPKPG